MEFPKVEVASHQPGGCFLCGEANGPYIDTLIEEVKVLTPEGEQRIAPARLYICIGNEERPGCVAQMITAVGGVPPWVHTAQAEQHRVQLEQVVAREEAAQSLVQQLRSAIDKATGDSGHVEPSTG